MMEKWEEKTVKNVSNQKILNQYESNEHITCQALVFYTFNKGVTIY